MKRFAVLILLTLLLGGANTASAYLITNGDFDSDLAGWTQGGLKSAIGWDAGRVKFTNPAGGEKFTSILNYKFNIPLLKPTGAAVNQLRLSFDFAYNDNASTVDFFRFRFRIKDPSSSHKKLWTAFEELTRIVTYGTQGAGHIDTFFTLTDYDYQLADLATNAQLQFAFRGNKNSAWSNIWIDNVEVVPLPEPSTLVLLAVGLGGCALFGVRKKKQ